MNKFEQIVLNGENGYTKNFKNQLVQQIGIRGEEGTTIFFNNQENRSIVLGKTGIFEIDLSSSIFSITNIKSDKKEVIVDVVYRDGEGA